ncbi:MAG: OmpA family protein [Candidatus Korobacteraceae bacterium]
MVGDAVSCTLGDKACVDQAKAKNEKVVIVDKDGKVITDERGNPASTQEEATARTEKPGEGVWRNYDFVPGKRVLYASDFSQERVGRFPANQLEFVSGNAQIVEMDGRKVLEISQNSVFRVKLPEALKEGYTLEFSYLLPAPNMAVNVFFGSPQVAVSRWESHYISVFHTPGIYSRGTSVSSISARQIVKQMTPVKFQADGAYAMLYVGTERAANLPNASIQPSDVVEFRATANANFRAYLTDIVVAAGLDPLYETLMKEGSYTTRGILFAVDSAELRPESTPELIKIEEMLKRDTKIRLIIEGHTDSTGEQAHNMDLSQRRAAAVVAYLAGKGVAKDRLEPVGKGQTAPVASNDTPQGREQNRRVVVALKKA